MSNKPIIALIYDFDNTLSTHDMQEFNFIPELGMTPDEFWGRCGELSKEHNMDSILAYMLLMAQKANEKGIDLSRESLRKMGQQVEFFDGVEQWFKRINAYGARLGFEVRHYIISCGLKHMIEGCPIGHEFYNVFACDYVYDDDGHILWPSVAINYTSKTQFLYRINKGIEDAGEDKKLNMYMPTSERAVPFENMIYIGDGLTDVPSMKLTRTRGGYAIGVYRNPEDATYLVKEDRVDFYVQSNYTPDSEMDIAMKAIFQKIKARERFKKLSESSYNAARQDKK